LPDAQSDIHTNIIAPFLFDNFSDVMKIRRAKSFGKRNRAAHFANSAMRMLQRVSPLISVLDLHSANGLALAGFDALFLYGKNYRLHGMWTFFLAMRSVTGLVTVKPCQGEFCVRHGRVFLRNLCAP